MLQILFVTTDPEPMAAVLKVFSRDAEVRLHYAASGAEALQRLRKDAPHLVIIDQHVPDADPVTLITKMLAANAMVNTAVVSTLPDEDFHEAYEGLGVLDRLPANPTEEDGHRLLEKLRRVLG